MSISTAFIPIMSCGAYIFDTVTDIILAKSFFTNGDTRYFLLTVILILLSAIYSNKISYDVARKDLDENDKPKFCYYAFNFLIHFCLLGVMHRYAWIIFCGSSGNAIDSATIDRLQLIEITTEAGPQLLLQLYIIFANMRELRPQFQTSELTGFFQQRTEPPIVTEEESFWHTSPNMFFEVVSVVTSLTSIAWVFTKFTKPSRRKSNMGDFYYFIWHVFSIGTRIFALSLFASIFKIWVFVYIFFRCVVVNNYLLSKSHKNVLEDFDRYRKLCHENFFHTFLFSFSNFNKRYEPKKSEYVKYFIFVSIEDTILMFLWMWMIDPAFSGFLDIGFAIHYTCVGLGLLFMLIYLRCVNQDDESRV